MPPPRHLFLPGLALALLAALRICSRTLGTFAGEVSGFLGERGVYAADVGGLHPGDDLAAGVSPGGGGREERREILAPPLPDPDEEGAAAEEDPGTRLHGRVTRRGGAPVEGATVVLRRSQGWIAPPADLEEMTALRNDGARHEALTDAEGVFVLRNVEACSAALAIRAAGCSPLSRDQVPIPEHESYDLGTFELELGVEVSGQVVGPKGRGVEGVLVLSAVSPDAGSLRLDLPGHGVPLTRTDADGGFVVGCLATGSWHLLFDHPDYRVAERTGVTEPAGSSERGVRISLEEGLSIEGRVEGIEGSAEAPLRVTARRDREQPSGAADDVVGAEKHRPRHGEVLGDGSFAVRGLAPGVRYKLRLERRRTAGDGEDPGGSPERWSSVRGVEDVAEMAGARDVLLSHRAEAKVTLSVVDARTGRPVERFLLTVSGRRLGGSGILKGDDDEPRRSFPGGEAASGGLRPSEQGTAVSVRVLADGYEELERSGSMLWPGRTLELGRVELQPAATVAVVVLDEASGQPIAGARVLAARSADAQALEEWAGRWKRRRPLGVSEVRDAVCDERGRAAVTLWSGSVCQVEGVAAGYLRGEARQSIPPHGEELELRLSRGATATVRVTDGDGRPVAGMPVEHTEVGAEASRRGRGRMISVGYVGGGEPDEQTNDAGVIVFGDLPAGLHRFRAVERRNPWGGSGESAGGEAEGELVLAGGGVGELELRVPTRGGFIARILESGGPLSGGLVRLSPIAEAGGDDENAFLRFGGGQEDPLTRVTDHAGRVSFDHLKVGSYELRISHPERRMTVTHEALVVRDPLEQVIEIGNATIAGRVLDPEGLPIEGVSITVASTERRRDYDGGDYRVRITEDAEGDPDWDFEQVKQWAIRSDRNGEYVLRGVLPGEELRVSARDPYVRGETRRAGPLGTDEYLAGFDFRLEPAGVLSVAVSSFSPGDSRRVEVRAERIGEDGKGLDGRTEQVRAWRPEVTLSSIPPGRWRVRLVVDRAEEALRELEVEVPPRQTVRIEL